MPATLAEAIAAIKAGRKDEARVMLMRILATDGNNVTALLWMTEVATTTEERRTYLARILALDPSNQLARKGLELLSPINEPPPWMSEKEQPPRDTVPIATQTLKRIAGWRTSQKALLLAIAALTVVILATLASLLFGIPTQSGNQVEVRPTENNQQFPTARPATPTEVTRPTPTIRPSSIDKDIVISGWKCTLQEYVDSVLFEGTVKNISPRTYSFVRIRVAVFDNAGNLRNTNTSYIESDVLIPNATSSFKAYVDNNGGTKCAVVIESGILEK